jgi:hypothetical protein
MTNAIETFSGLIGFYALTPQGALGYYDQDWHFHLDEKLTQAFGDYNRRYLLSYLQNPHQGNLRLAVIHRTGEDRPWGSETLLLEKPILRRLYPVAGMTAEVELTSFQKKNREKSIYRGMELLLEYRDSANPNMPVYCPVLYDRGTALHDYAASLDRPLTAADRETPVVEVINLLAGIPVGRRSAPQIGLLQEKIYQGIIKKGLRKSADFTLIEDARGAAGTGRPQSLPPDPYSEVDKRAERRVTLDTASSVSAAGDPAALSRQLGAPLIGHPEPAAPATLKAFTQFRDLDHEKLAALASRCLLYRVPAGTKLLERGTDDTWNLYLVEGTVQLEAADGMTRLIEGGTEKAASPISYLKPRLYAVTAMTRVAFLWMDDRLIEQVLRDDTFRRRDARV